MSEHESCLTILFTSVILILPHGWVAVLGTNYVQQRFCNNVIKQPRFQVLVLRKSYQITQSILSGSYPLTLRPEMLLTSRFSTIQNICECLSAPLD